MKRIKLFIVFLLFCSAFFAEAQSYANIFISYDTNGNRTQIDYIIIRVDENEPMDYLSAPEETTSDELTLDIYPNPTTGFLIVSSNKYDNAQLINAKLMSLQGTTIDERTISSDRTEFDLTQSPAGIYFLYIECNSEKQLWKIIKR